MAGCSLRSSLSLSANTCTGELPRNKQRWTDCRANHNRLSKSSPRRRWVGARPINRAPKAPATAQKHRVPAPLRRVGVRSRRWLPPTRIVSEQLGSRYRSGRSRDWRSSVRRGSGGGLGSLTLCRNDFKASPQKRSGLRSPKLHDLPREHVTNWVRAVIPERRKRHREGKAHETDGFVVELLAVLVCFDRHETRF
jgi:hypothetical protein